MKLIGEKPVERFEEPQEYAGYGVRNPLGNEIDRVQRLFVNGEGEPEYVRVKMGLFGRKAVPIPVCSVALDAERKTLTLK